MPTIRILSYNLHGCHDMSALYRVIVAASADIIAVQNVSSLPVGNSVATIATQTGYGYTSIAANGSLAIIAREPVKFVQTYDLGGGASCMKLDLLSNQRRFILFNVGLRGGFFKRPSQIRSLLGPNLIDSGTLALPTILVGDFYDIIWVSGHYRFNDQLRRYTPPFLRATYPAVLPVFSRDRVYAMGGVSLTGMTIDHGQDARTATSHLPLFFDLKITDSRIDLTTREQAKAPRIEVATN